MQRIDVPTKRRCRASTSTGIPRSRCLAKPRLFMSYRMYIQVTRFTSLRVGVIKRFRQLRESRGHLATWHWIIGSMLQCTRVGFLSRTVLMGTFGHPCTRCVMTRPLGRTRCPLAVVICDINVLVAYIDFALAITIGSFVCIFLHFISESWSPRAHPAATVT